VLISRVYLRVTVLISRVVLKGMSSFQECIKRYELISRVY